jgi:hypothetical protein
MSTRPSTSELVEAVCNFLEARVLPELDGHTAFHARVAVNVLGIVAREIKTGADVGEAERLRLVQLLGQDGPRDTLNRKLCRRIRSGEVGPDMPGLLDHVELTVRGHIAIDQPQYAGLKRNPGTGLQAP